MSTLTTTPPRRYLVDNDRDEEGLKVIADFHDGNLDDPITKAEFAEIKEAILADVSAILSRIFCVLFVLIPCFVICSAPSVTVLTSPSGDATKVVC